MNFDFLNILSGIITKKLKKKKALEQLEENKLDYEKRLQFDRDCSFYPIAPSCGDENYVSFVISSKQG